MQKSVKVISILIKLAYIELIIYFTWIFVLKSIISVIMEKHNEIRIENIKYPISKLMMEHRHQFR